MYINIMYICIYVITLSECPLYVFFNNITRRNELGDYIPEEDLRMGVKRQGGVKISEYMNVRQHISSGKPSDCMSDETVRTRRMTNDTGTPIRRVVEVHTPAARIYTCQCSYVRTNIIVDDLNGLLTYESDGLLDCVSVHVSGLYVSACSDHSKHL